MRVSVWLTLLVAVLMVFGVSAVSVAGDPACCAGYRGDLNMSGLIDLADLSTLILYMTTTPRSVLPCADEANVNGAGIIDLVDLSLLISYLTGAGGELAPCTYGSTVRWSACKGPGLMTAAEADSNCLVWSYDGTDLTLTHVNTILNCCIGSAPTSYQFLGDTIFITESETPGPFGYCKCLCPYDVDLRIENVQAGTYRIRIIELYREPGQEIDAVVNLVEGSGTVCVVGE